MLGNLKIIGSRAYRSSIVRSTFRLSDLPTTRSISQWPRSDRWLTGSGLSLMLGNDGCAIRCIGL